MKTLLFCLDIVFLIPFSFFSLYLAILSLLAMFRKEKPLDTTTGKRRKFAILVPAHNEEEVIERTLSSLARIEYPRELFDVIVIADNCTDRTAAISRSMGANKVFERFDRVLIGKGHALKWCLDRIITEEPSYEAFVMIDADTVASENLLSVMNAHLELGADCIQCADMAIPQPGAWSPEITRVAFMLYNYVRPLARMSMGCSAGLRGNGMCFTRDLLVKFPWDSYSRAEDLEYSIRLSLENVAVRFAPETAVNTVMPTDPRDAETQRRRWEMGRFPIIKKYAVPLFLASIRKRSFMIFDQFIDLITPAFVNLVALEVVLFLLQVILLVLGSSRFLPMAISFEVALALDAVHVLCGLKAAKASHSAYSALLNTPRYAFWKFRLYLKTMAKGDDKEWVRTAHADKK